MQGLLSLNDVATRASMSVRFIRKRETRVDHGTKTLYGEILRFRAFIVVLALLAGGLLAGCTGDGEYSPFEGDWVSAIAGRLSFDKSDWWDGDGDSGSYSFTGEYPRFQVLFKSGGGDSLKAAAFLDSRTFELCDIAADGALVNCNDFVYDRPTLH